MNNNGFAPEYYPIVTQVIRMNGKVYARAYQPDFDYLVMEIYQPKLQSQMASLIYRVQSELKIKIELLKIEGKPRPSPSKPRGSFDPDTHFELSTSQVARLLNVSSMTVVRLSDGGSLPCKKTPKGFRRFKRTDIEKYLSNDTLGIGDASPTLPTVSPIAFQTPSTEV